MASNITNVPQVFDDRSGQEPKNPDTQLFELVFIILC